MKTSIKYEYFDITKMVQSIDIIEKNFNIVKLLKKTNKKASYIVENNAGVKFFLKAKLKDFVSENEIYIYKKIKDNPHPNINKVISLYQTDKFILILNEYIDGFYMTDSPNLHYNKFTWCATCTDINSNIIEEFDTKVDSNIDKIFNQLIKATVHLHSLGIIHCDIKPSNVMITQNMTAILIDYDLAKKFDHAQNILLVPKFYGTKGFISPETAKGLIYKNSDIWNLGMLFYLYIFRNSTEQLFFYDNDENTTSINNKLIEHYDGKYKNIINAICDMLNVSPEKRIVQFV